MVKTDPSSVSSEHKFFLIGGLVIIRLLGKLLAKPSFGAVEHDPEILRRYAEPPADFHFIKLFQKNQFQSFPVRRGKLGQHAFDKAFAIQIHQSGVQPVVVHSALRCLIHGYKSFFRTKILRKHMAAN